MKDLIIIGAGPGGYELALEASRLGLSVILIEKEKLGGTCLNHGCIPTKSYYQNALVLKDLKEKEVYGISGDFTFDFKKVKERKDNVVETLCKGIEFSFSKSSVELVYGKASFVDKNTVLVNDITYTAKNIVIATGSSPIRNLFEGSNLEGVLTSEELLDLEVLPKELVIIGGGVIGIEMATIFNTFGVKVEIIEMCDRILPLIDSDISKRLQSYLKALGIGIHTKSSLQKIEKSEGKLKAIFTEKGKELSLLCDNVLVSVGRCANVNSLDLEKVNIEYTKKGRRYNMKKFTRLVGILLTLAMVLSMMPATVIGAVSVGTSTGTGEIVQGRVLNIYPATNITTVFGCYTDGTGADESTLWDGTDGYCVTDGWFGRAGYSECPSSDGLIALVIMYSTVTGFSTPETSA